MVSTSPRRAAVLGHPIAHSLSPVLHRTAFAELGLPWRYDAVDVTVAGLPAFVDGLGGEWVGLSLTMPLKETVLDLLDEVDPAAAQVRAVNTVVFGDHRRRFGYNTDISGLVGVLNASAPPTFSRAVVVGAGATARSAVAALVMAGAGRVSVAARRPEAAADLVELAGAMGLPAGALSWPPSASDLDVDVVVSTIPAEAGRGLLVPAGASLLVDVLYDPWPTPLATAWAAAGGTVVGGLELLVRQAVEQVVLMSGRRPDVDAMRRAGQLALDQRSGSPKIAQADQ